MDAAGSGRAALLGTSEAGALNLLFSATHPDRTAALILLNSYARLTWAEDYPFGIRPNDADRLLEVIESGWGKGVAFEALVASQSDNQAMRNWWARYQRQAASPGAAVTLLRRAFDTDARGVLSAITVPTLILHKQAIPSPAQNTVAFSPKGFPRLVMSSWLASIICSLLRTAISLSPRFRNFSLGFGMRVRQIEFLRRCFLPISWARPSWQLEWATADGTISFNRITPWFARNSCDSAEPRSILRGMACSPRLMARRVPSGAVAQFAMRCTRWV
jgi:hypothetical protein